MRPCPGPGGRGGRDRTTRAGRAPVFACWAMSGSKYNGGVFALKFLHLYYLQLSPSLCCSQEAPNEEDSRVSPRGGELTYLLRNWAKMKGKGAWVRSWREGAGLGGGRAEAFGLSPLRLRYNQLILSICCNKTMIGKDSPFLEKLKHEKEVRQLQVELTDRMAQLQDKEAKILELQNTIAQITRPEPLRKLTEEETQCSFHQEDHEEVIRRFSEVLNQRQQEGVGLHLASQQKQEEISQLRQTLQARSEEAEELKERIRTMEGFLEVSMNDFDYLCNQNKTLRERVLRLEQEKGEAENRVLELESEGERWEELRQEKVHVMNERLQMQGEERLCMKEVEQRLKEELDVQGEELERVNAVLNNYEWKLFCLETELDLSNKERKQLKFTGEKLEAQISKLEATLKEQRVAMFRVEEENRLVITEKRYLATECKASMARNEQLELEVRNLRFEVGQHQEFKELTYSLKEKEEEMNEIVGYLKEKINELDQTKHKATFLEKELHENGLRLERLQHDNYEMEQNIVEHEQVMESQSARVQELEKALEVANKHLQDNSLFDMLRTSEWNEARSSLQSSVADQAQKINMLSVQIIERDIAAKKNAEKLHNTQQILEKYNEELIEVYQKLEETEARVTALCDLKAGREADLEKTLKRVAILEQNLKEREKIVMVLQAELKIVKGENSRVNKANQDLEEKTYLKDEEISSLKEKVVDQIEEELNYQFKIQQLAKENQLLKASRETLERRSKDQEIEVRRVKQEAKKLELATEAKMRELSGLLSNPEEKEETTKFQLLEEDEFEVMECQLEKQRNELRDKLEQCRAELATMARSLG